MTNVFRKYPRITNSYDAKFLAKIAEHGLYASNIKWSVSEKLHGANLSLYCDGIGIEIASRNSMLENSDSFYHLGTIKDELNDIVITIQNYFQESVKVYGELVGGSYPHPDVKKGNIKQIQKGVFYCPGLKFSVFDIKVDETFLSVQELEQVCLSLDILHQDSLFKGTLTECLAFPNDGMSEFSDLIDLPRIEGNIMEGVVIKPMLPFFMGDHRVILKNKNDKFKEKNEVKKRLPKQTEPLSKEMEETLESFQQYITVNRLDTATSKLGEVENTNIGAFLKELHTDIILEAEEDGFDPTLYSKDEIKFINKFINAETKKLIFARIKGEI